MALDRQLELVGVGNTYRIAVLEQLNSGASETFPDRQSQSPTTGNPPVEEGDVREVEIEGIGEQGDGLARVDRGYVVFVPETDVGDRVTVEITETRENVAFAEVIGEEPVQN